MNKLLAALSLPLMASSLFKCQLFNVDKKNIDYSEQYNPGYVFHLSGIRDNQRINIDNYTYTFNYEDRDETQELISNYIPSESHFYHIEEDAFDSSGLSFEYKVEKQLLLGSSGYTFVFYKNGYVRATTRDKDLPAYYYYKFDSSVAERLYNKAFSLVDAHRQEILDKEMEKKRFEEMISTFSLNDVLNDFREMDVLSFDYYSYSPTEYSSGRTLEDDGTIKDLILNATYEELSSSVKDDSSYRKTFSFSRYLRDEEGKEVWSYSFSLSENSYVVSLYKTMTDKYERRYSKSLYFSIGRDTTHAIFDKAIALYEESEQISKAAEERLTNFTMENVINDIKEQDPFIFTYQAPTYAVQTEQTDVRDDGSVEELLVNATYETCNSYSRDLGVRYEKIILYREDLDEDGNRIFSYYCEMYLDGIIEMSLFMEDETGRYHYYDKTFRIEKVLCETIFAKARELVVAQENQAE